MMAYFDTRLSAKARMMSPWYFVFDYPLAYAVTNIVGLKYVPGLDANVISLMHPLFAIACVYFLVTSIREVPVGRGGRPSGRFRKPDR